MDIEPTQFSKLLKERLQPSGTMQIVRIWAGHAGSAAYYSKSFVDSAVDEAAKVLARGALGEMPTALETLAIHSLAHSAGLSSMTEIEKALGEMLDRGGQKDVTTAT